MSLVVAPQPMVTEKLGEVIFFFKKILNALDATKLNERRTTYRELEGGNWLDRELRTKIIILTYLKTFFSKKNQSFILKKLSKEFFKTKEMYVTY